MKLRHIKVNQFQKFTAPTAMMGVEDGLNVLAGPNELGKSTMVRALQTVMFENYGAKTKAINALRNTQSQAAPVIEVGFELDDGLYTLRKRFLSGAYAKLTLPDGTIIQNESAENRLRSILHFDKAGRGGASAETMGVWSLLWVPQGEGWSPTSASALAQNTLRGALEDTVGDVLGGVQGQMLPTIIADAKDKLLTATSKPTGAYREAAQTAEEAKNLLDELIARRDGLDKDLADFAIANDTLTQYQKDDVAGELKTRLEETQVQLDGARKVAEKLEQAQNELKRREEDVERAQAAKEGRLALGAKVTKAQATFDRLAADLVEADDREKVLEDRLQTAKAGREAAATERTRAESDAKQAAEKLALIELAEQAVQQSQRLSDARALVTSIEEADKALAANLVTEAVLDAIGAAVVALSSAQARLSAVATEISFELQSDKVGDVSVNDGSIDASCTIEAVAATRIAIRGVGVVEVKPRISDVETMRVERDEAQAALQELLDQAGVENEPAARAARQARQKLERERAEALTRLDTLVPDENGGVGALEEKVAKSLATLKGSGMDADSARDVDAQREASRVAAGVSEAALKALESARDRQEGVAQDIDEHRKLWVDSREAKARAEETLKNVRQEDEDAPALEDLQKRLDDMNSLVMAQRGTVDALDTQLSANPTEALEARLKRITESIDAHENRVRQAQRDKDRLEGVIQASEGAGLAERVADAERNHELAKLELEKYAQEAEVLALLSDTLGAAQKEAFDQFMAPIVKKVTPYLNLLFPASTITLSEDMGVASVSRGRTAEQGFDNLSMGTQEQLSILTRIAFAELLAEQGEPAMLVLDDAFAYSDDVRMENLLDVLTIASSKIQILLLTCRESMFAGVGGNALRLVEEDDDAMASN